MIPESLEEILIIPIQLTKETVRQLHFYAKNREMTIEEYIPTIISRALDHLQIEEKLKRDFEEWIIPRIIEVIPKKDFSLEVKFEDGMVGKYDMTLSIQRGGVFSALADYALFLQVSIGGHGNFIFWPDEIDIGADTIYMTVMQELDGKWGN